MVIVVEGHAVRLDDPEDCTAFKVRVDQGTEAQVGEALARVGRMADRDTAWIDADAVRALAEGRVGDGWDEAFSGMLAYAVTKGWLSPDGTQIQAHIEWPSA